MDKKKQRRIFWEGGGWSSFPREIFSNEYRKLIDAKALAVYMALCYFADLDGYSFPSINTIADHARLSRSSVLRVIKQLEALFIISVTRATNDDGGKASNQYQLNLPQRWARKEVAVSKRHSSRNKTFNVATKKVAGSVKNDKSGISEELEVVFHGDPNYNHLNKMGIYDTQAAPPPEGLSTNPEPSKLKSLLDSPEPKPEVPIKKQINKYPVDWKLQNDFIAVLKKHMGIERLGKTEGENRNQINNLIRLRMVPDFYEADGRLPTEMELIEGLDKILTNMRDWHRSRVDNFLYLYRNYLSIIQNE